MNHDLRTAMLLTLAATLLTTTLAAQNLVSNPGFEAATLSPWTHNGTGSVHQAAVALYDVTGKGMSKAFAGTPDTTPITLKQALIPIRSGGRYAFSMDVASFWPNPNFACCQADAGRFTVFVGTQQVSFLSLGSVTAANPLLRRSVAVVFTATTSGLLDVQIQMSRIYAGRYGTTPRCYVDNIEVLPLLSVTPYGTACGSVLFSASVTGTAQQQLEQTVYTGKAGSAGLMLIGTQKTNIPFLGCSLLTDFPFLFAYAMPAGIWSLKVPIPATFTGPVNIQHFVRLPNNTIEATNAVTIQ